MHRLVHAAHMAPPIPHLALVVPTRHTPPSSQQPVAQEAALHVHEPPTQLPAPGHAGPEPHEQRPFAEHESARIRSQATHVPPAVPQFVVLFVRHEPPRQQPLGHEAALHTQDPLTHAVPAGQAALAPQRQVPDASSQLLEAGAVHEVQAAPPTPQVANAGLVQVPLAQHPRGHELALHTQAPATQLVPAPQAGPPPHRHPPAAAQLSARLGSQVVQAAPAVPQAMGVGMVVQVEPEQQPLQLLALQLLHTPPAQGPSPQFWQTPPPLPHIAAVVPGRQEMPEQHPDGHDVPSQTHTPAWQRAPSAHGGPFPQAQAPIGVQRLAVAPQRTQAAPATPQVAGARGRHTPPAQQPSTHAAASHTQAPPTQRWPAVQAAPAPHTHTPLAVQVSDVTGSHGLQTLPAVPHFAKLGVAQLLPSQQPVEQETAPQPQTPFWQRRPAPQAGPVPQVQVPVGEQPSAAAGSQPTHTAPPTPQVASDGGLQVAPEQQPSRQVALHPLQRPSVQVWPLGQVSHAPPPPPQEAAVSPARQVVPEQQPSLQDVPSQTQVLPMQRWPRAHAGPPPQRQLPLAEQLSLRASHTAQVEPASPQLLSERVAHTAPWQQPLGQEVPSQMHSPATHRCPPAQAGPVPH